MTASALGNGVAASAKPRELSHAASLKGHTATLEPVPHSDEAEMHFEKDGLGYRLVTPDARISIDYIRITSEDVKGWISISVHGEDIDGEGVLLEQWFNIGSALTQDKLVKSLTARSGARPWDSYIQTFCSSVMANIREGEPWQKVGRLSMQARSAHLIDNVIPAHEVSTIFAPGNSGKGHLSMSIGFAVALDGAWLGRKINLQERQIETDHVFLAPKSKEASARHGCGVTDCGKPMRVHQRDPKQPGVVWILDWEDYVRTADERIKAHARGMGLADPEDFPEMDYRHCVAPLKTYIHQLVRKAQAEQPDLIIIDSVGQAMGSSGEAGNYEDQANEFFALLRLLSPATILLIDHVKGDGVTEGKLTGKAFGSVYKLNNIHGMAWEILKDQDAGDATSTVAWFNVKNNNGVLQEPLCMTLEFGGDVPGIDDYVRLAHRSINESPILAQYLPPYQRVLGLLLRIGRSHPSKVSDELQNEAKATGTKAPFKDEDAVRPALDRWAKNGKLGMDEIGRFYALEREELAVRRDRRMQASRNGTLALIRPQEEDKPVYRDFN